MYHVSFIFTLPDDPQHRFGKIIFNYLDHPNENLDIQIRFEIFESMRKTIQSIGILSVFEYPHISDNEKYAFDLYIDCINDWYHSTII